MPDLGEIVVPAGTLSGHEQLSLAIDELVLRPWRAADVAAVVEAYGDPLIQRWHLRSMTESEAVAWLTCWRQGWVDETRASWAIACGDAAIGRVEVKGLDLASGVGEAAYWVIPSARGRDVAPRALRAVTGWMFDRVGLHRIELLHSTRNEASCRVADKAGYALEGTKLEHWCFPDGWHDVHSHACVVRVGGPLASSELARGGMRS